MKVLTKIKVDIGTSVCVGVQRCVQLCTEEWKKKHKYE